MDTGTLWRSKASAEHYAEHDYADFAQEFLRRNSEYRRDYTAIQTRIEADSSIAKAEQEGLAGRWGLSFPFRSYRQSKGKARALVTNHRTRRRHHRNG